MSIPYAGRFTMDIVKFICFINILIICGSPLFIDAQPLYGPAGYGRSRMMGRRMGMYPGGYPGGYPSGYPVTGELYPVATGPRIVDGSVLHPPVYQDSGYPLMGGGRPVLPIVQDAPAVVKDRSGRQNINLNIVNNNENVHDSSHSGNSVVRQGRRQCPNACPGGTCPYPSQCLFTGDTECPTRCQSFNPGPMGPVMI